jgi:hypothetical protein
MTTAFLLIALGVVICLTTLVGGALFFVGLVKKSRPVRRAGTILFVSSLFGLAGCFTYASVKVFQRLKSASPKQYWHAMVAAAFDDTAIRPLDPSKAKQILSAKLTNTSFLSGVDVQGVWVEGAVLSYGYFLYAADEKELLRAVATAPIDSSFHLTSDVACREVTWAECKDKLMYEKGPQRNLPGWAPESAAEKRCYSCLRCPWSHTILVDGKTGKVYHSISEIRE